MNTIYLIRHGESRWNACRRIQGHLDSSLSLLGRRQAQALCPVMDSLAVDAVFASDLTRARETAELACPAKVSALQVTPDLRENSFGHWEGLSPEQVHQQFPEEWERFRLDPIRGRPASAETYESFSERARRLLGLWQEHYEGQTIAAFTHGGMVRMVLFVLLDLPASSWRTLRVANTGLTRVDLLPAGPVLRWFNITSHLASLRTPSTGDKAEEDE